MARRRNQSENVAGTMIWCRDYEWQAIKSAANSNKLTLSDYITDKLMAFEGVPTNIEYNKDKPGKRCNVYVEKTKWEVVKQRARDCGQPTGRYIMNILLKDIENLKDWEDKGKRDFLMCTSM